MVPDTLVAPTNDVFGTNLAALELRSGRLAKRLANVDIPPTVRPIIGRDGSPTFRIDGDDCQWHYLGYTSMPSVRAAALVDGFNPDGGNVLIPKFGNGREVGALLERTASHCAVFVHGDDFLDVRLALTLTDFADDFRTGRLILLYGADLCKSLIGFFEAFPGYEFPQKMLAPPYMDTGTVESIRVSIHRAASHVAQMQLQQVKASTRILSERAGSDAEPSSLGILTIDPRPMVVDVAEMIRSAATRSGMRITTCIPDRPDRCHCLARIQRLAHDGSEAALLLNCGWGQLCDHIPEDYPATSWLLPGAKLLRGLTDGFASRHIVLAATPQLQREAVEAGVNAARVRLLEVASDDTIFRTLDWKELEAADKRFDVACFGDFPDLQPGACGIVLESHQRLWDRLCATAAEQTHLSPEKVLETAEQVSGVVLTEEDLRNRFLALIRLRVLPSLQMRTAAESLRAANFDVKVFGNGWQFSSVPAADVNAPPPKLADRNAIYNAARVVVCPVFDAQTVQVCLDAVTAGGCVVCRGPQERLESCHPQLTDVLAEIPMFEDTATMLRLVGSLVRQERQRTIRCDHARRIIADHHLWSHRLATIRQSLADRRRKP